MWTLEDNYLLESAGVIDISFLHHFAWRRFLIMACKRLFIEYIPIRQSSVSLLAEPTSRFTLGSPDLSLTRRRVGRALRNFMNSDTIARQVYPHQPMYSVNPTPR